MSEFPNDYAGCRGRPLERLQEPAPDRIQLLTGPRQVGKTTLLLEIAGKFGEAAVYAAGDEPDAALPGFWERRWAEAEDRAQRGKAVLLLDEVHRLGDWASRLKGQWDLLQRRRLPLHVVATGSSALRVATGSRESLAGRFERLTLSHWSASSLAATFQACHRPGRAGARRSAASGITPTGVRDSRGIPGSDRVAAEAARTASR